MSIRLTDEIVRWTETSLDLYRMGDQVTYDVTIGLDPQHGPLAIVMLWMPGLVVGEQMQVVGAMPNAGTVTQEQVSKFVLDGLDAMRAQRSQQAAGGPQEGTGTLLVPGRT